MSRYDDIINLPHHVSVTHKPMTMEARAAQFAPFAALTGHEDAIRETGRITDAKDELSAEEQKHLSETLCQVLEMEAGREVVITCFIPDKRKKGGRYVEIQGTVRKLDEYDRTIVMDSGSVIPLDDVSDIRIL